MIGLGPAAAELPSPPCGGDGLRLEFDAQMRSRVVASLERRCVPRPLHLIGDAADRRRGTARLRTRQAARRPMSAMRWARAHAVVLTGRCRRRHQARRGERSTRPTRTGCSCACATPTTARRRSRCSATSATATNSSPRRASPSRPSGRTSRASYESRPDWLLPLRPGYQRGNFLGMNNPRLRRRHAGARRVAPRYRRGDRPRRTDARNWCRCRCNAHGRGNVELALSAQRDTLTLAAGRELRHRCAVSSACTTAITSRRCALRHAHAGAGPEALPPTPADAFEPIWCAWGYGREFTPQQIFDSLPVVKQLGFRWAVRRRRLAGGRRATGRPTPSEVPGRRCRHEGDGRRASTRPASRRSCGGRRWPRIPARAPSASITTGCCRMSTARPQKIS